MASHTTLMPFPSQPVVGVDIQLQKCYYCIAYLPLALPLPLFVSIFAYYLTFNMPTLEYFNECPEFPADTQEADDPIISYKNLLDNSDKKSKDLCQASTEYGFFLLDLCGTETGDQLLHDAATMFELSKRRLTSTPKSCKSICAIHLEI
jgi:hypothetical protein